MNVLFIFINSYKESLGGIERFALNLIKYLSNYHKNNNHSFYLLFLNSSENLVEKISDNLIVEHFILDKNEPNSLHKKLNEIHSQYGVDKLVLENFIFIDIAKVIQVYNFCITRSLSCFLHIHSFPTNEVQTAIVRDFDWEKVICVSYSVAGDCLSKNVNPKKLVVNHLGVDTETFKPNNEYKKFLHKYFELDDKRKIILHASRIITGNRDILKEKGFFTLLEAFHKFYNDYQDYDLVFSIAKAPSRLNEHFFAALDKLKNYIEIYNLTSRVHIGIFDSDEMPQVYNSSDIFVLASENETFGQVVIEAMASGVPVITTSVGGLVEIARQELNAMVVSPNNPIALEKALLTYIKQSKVRKNIIENSIRLVNEKFELKKQLNMFLDIITA